MAIDFKKYKKTSASELQKILDDAEKNKNGGGASFKDDRFWHAEQDKAGNAFAIIRFLDVVLEDELPWVRVFSHSFQGAGGKWYIENSLTTFNEDDPVAEYNSALWNSGSDANKEIARQQKRKLQYYTKILVVADSKHPENEGKVFFFKFGKKIFDKIMDKARPTFEDEKPVNVFNFLTGADFKLKIRKVEGYANYDKSEFAEPAPLAGGDEKLMAQIVEAAELLGPISQFLDRKKYFKTYEELEAKFQKVIKATKLNQTEDTQAPADQKTVGEKPVGRTKNTQSEDNPDESATDDKNETLSYFQKLADDKSGS